MSCALLFALCALFMAFCALRFALRHQTVQKRLDIVTAGRLIDSQCIWEKSIFPPAAEPCDYAESLIPLSCNNIPALGLPICRRWDFPELDPVRHRSRQYRQNHLDLEILLHGQGGGAFPIGVDLEEGGLRTFVTLLHPENESPLWLLDLHEGPDRAELYRGRYPGLAEACEPLSDRGGLCHAIVLRSLDKVVGQLGDKFQHLDPIIRFLKQGQQRDTEGFKILPLAELVGLGSR